MIKNYVKIALRNLKRQRAYTLINVVGLALGMACAILIFTLVKYHLNFDTFHAHTDRIYRVVTEIHGERIDYTGGVPSPVGKAFREDYSFAEKVARVVTFNGLISIPSSVDNRRFEEDAGVAFAEPEYFEIFHFPLNQGNPKTALTEPNSAVISQRLARKYFGEENPMDKLIRFDNKLDFRITGILQDIPATTDRRQEIYVSYANLKEQHSFLARDDAWGGVFGTFHCFVLLKPSVSAETVNRAFPGLSKKYYQGKDADSWQFRLQPLSDVHFNADFGGTVEKSNLWALSLIGLFLVITACVNFINLATAQALNRAKEIGVRKVMGSQRSQLFGQFMSETALITLVGLGLALLLAWLALPYLNQLLDTRLVLGLFQDFRLVLFLLGLFVVVVFLSGSYPSLILAGFQPIMALRGKLSQKHVGGFSLRRGLVISQFAISQVLIIGTIIVTNQMRYSQQSDLGFKKEAIVLLPIPNNQPDKLSTLRTRLAQVTGIENLTMCSQAPASSRNFSTGIQYDNRPEEENFPIYFKAGDTEYTSLFGLSIVAGRNLYPSDTIREYLINETAVKKLLVQSNEAVLGKTATINGKQGTIVGVVKDFHNLSFHESIAAVCITTSNRDYRTCSVKINAKNTTTTLAAMESIWQEVYPDFLYKYDFLDDRLAQFYELETIILRLVQIFAAIAIFISCLGLYGLVSFMAAQKTKEIGVRKVLGASIENIVWLFAKEFMRLLLVAFVLAAPVAWWAMNGWLDKFAYKIDVGAGVFAVAIGLTLLIAVVTVGYRSISAALMNPIKSLRSE